MASRDSWGGWIGFAGIVLLVVGALDVLQGFVAIIEDEYVVATAKGLAIVDVTGWGWITLLWGVLLVFAGLGLLSGASWARWLAIVGVALNAIQQIMFHGELPAGVSALEHLDRRAQRRRALRADGTLAGLQGLSRTLTADSDRIEGLGCSAGPSIRVSIAPDHARSGRVRSHLAVEAQKPLTRRSFGVRAIAGRAP